jgi:predicted DNA-binding antitoxin AbrB/MazE fold protein
MLALQSFTRGFVEPLKKIRLREGTRALPQTTENMEKRVLRFSQGAFFALQAK